MTRHPFTEEVLTVIRAIPAGRVATYGSVAAMAGNRKAARQVARILHSMSEGEALPWHRVVNREGRVAVRSSEGTALQRELLEAEGVLFDASGRIDLTVFLWI